MLKFLVKLGFPSKRKWTKNQLLEFIWKIQNEENFDRVASSMEGKGKRTYSDELKDKLPMLHVYREQFASIDRLDIFLSNSDSEIRHQSWRDYSNESSSLPSITLVYYSLSVE